MTEFIPDSFALNIVLFFTASSGVWFTASKLTKYLDIIAERTGMGRAFAGILFLGVATSLPEIATTGTAASTGNAELAVTNLMGGVAMQILVLALVDFLANRGKALTSRAPKAVLIMQGVILILTIGMAIAAMTATEFFQFLNIGLWSCIIFMTYVFGLFAVYRFEGDPRWEPTEKSDDLGARKKLKEKHQKEFEGISTKNILFRFFVMALGVLITGYLVTKSAEKIVTQTGLSSGFVGATLLAFATSLPEITTTWSAVKLGAFSMVIGNILGTNTLEVALLFFADLFYREGPIISEARSNSVFLASLGIILTCVYVWGMLERRDRTILGMGVDSFLIILIYSGGMIIFSFM